MPRYNDLLVCGVSAQLHQYVERFDDLIRQTDEDFPSSGLKRDSVIRLGFLGVVPQERVLGSLGTVSAERHARLLKTLSAYLLSPSQRL